MVLTHPHDDHIQGLIEVLKRYEVKAVLLTGVSFSNPNYDEFLRIINEKKIPIFIADKDSDFSFGDVHFDVLYPINSLSGKTVKNINNSSIAMRVMYAGREIYLGGDDEIEVEQEILKSGQVINSDIYKASHHGSRTASSPEFLAKIKPEIAVIQCGVDNKFSHPHPETIRNLNRAEVQEIYRTDLDGRVEISF
jgi:competence protein ComEC